MKGLDKTPIGTVGMIVRRSLEQYVVSTWVTAASVALASGLMMSVFSLNAQTYNAFTGGAGGFDAVLGARGSQLQLVLNTVFHLQTSPGNIPWSLYKAISQDPDVELAVPYAVGDNYKGFRIVGTTDEVFTKLEYEKDRRFEMEPGGRPFTALAKEAVIGGFVASRTRLAVGDTLNPYHGIQYDESMKHDDLYTVVGIVKPTGTPSDRVVWIPIEGVYRMSGHVIATGAAAPAGPIPDQYKEVSAVMLKLHSPQAGFRLDQTINRQGKVATLAWPIGRVMGEIFDKLGWVILILELVAYLVAIVAAGSILASLYNTMNERRREFAILRALGARRKTIVLCVVLEAACIAGLGALLGFAVYTVVLGVAGAIVRAEVGVILSPFTRHPVLVLAPLLMIVLGALAGLVPAAKAYATDIATNLAPQS